MGYGWRSECYGIYSGNPSHQRAARACYQLLRDPLAVAKWKVSDGMTCHVHDFDGREGGSFRISLTYDAPDAIGKTSERTDTYRGSS